MAKLKMHDTTDIRKTLQIQAQKVSDKEIDVQTAKAVIYACQVALQAISTEEKIKDLVSARALAEKWDF